MKICAACGKEVSDGPVHTYWIPKLGKWCCDACKRFSDEVNAEHDSVFLRIIEQLSEPFENIEVGKAFLLNGNYFLRTVDHPYGSGIMNAVSLQDGDFREIWGDTLVQRVSLDLKRG